MRLACISQCPSAAGAEKRLEICGLRTRRDGIGRVSGISIAHLVAAVFCVALVVLLPRAAAAQTLDDARRLHAAGELSEALVAYRAVAESESLSDPLAAAVAHNNSCVIHMDRGDYNAALGTCLDAQTLLETTENARLRGRNLNNLGVVHQHLGRYDEAERYFLEALEANRARGDVESQVINLSNLGALATAAGWYARALDAHTSAETLAREHDDDPWALAQVRIAQINRGVVLEKLGEYRKALDIYREVLANRGDVHPWYEASLQINVGVLYRNLGDPVTAVGAFEEAISAYGDLGDAAGLSNAYLNLALARHLNLDDAAGAESAYRTALELARESGDKTEEIQDLFYLGRLFAETDRLGEAEDAFERCLAAANESGSAEGRWSALAGLGGVALARDDLAGALGFLRRAMSAVEEVRADLGSSAHRGGFFGDKRPIFDATVNVLARLEGREPGRGHAEEALQVAQRAKARQLLDRLGPGVRPVSPQTADALRELVGGATLLEYFVTADTVYMWIVRGSGIQMIDLGVAAPLLAVVARVHGSLASGREPDAGELTYLSEVLLAPARPALEAVSRLWIAADRRLHYLPFELLGFPGAPERRVIDSLIVGYLPSASMLASIDRQSGPIERMLAGFGNPALGDEAADPSATSELLVSRFDLGPLPEAERELDAAQRALGTPFETLTGSEATEEGFRRVVAQGARVVHLATHAVAFERPGQGPALVFAPAGADDGLLSAVEISGLEYHAVLTVLAACRTGIGSPDDGLALTTLIGSFLAAGSSAVLATLWDVEDAASAVFMEQFYYHLGRGAEPAVALRRTKQRMRSDPRWDRPAVWAAYVLVGDAPAVVDRAVVPAWAWIGAAALLVAGAAARVGRARRAPRARAAVSR